MILTQALSKRIAAGLTALAALSIVAAAADGLPTGVTTDDVVQRMVDADQARVARLREYTSVRKYSMVNDRFGAKASMTVKLTFHNPGGKQYQVIAESGPSAVRNKVFRRMLDSELDAGRDSVRKATQISPANYVFKLNRVEALDGRKCYVLDADPRTPNKYLFRGRVWVDAEEFAVARIEGAPAKNPSFWVRKTAFVHQYGKFGPFWLALSNRSDTDVVLFGHTRVTVEYGDYTIDPQ
jgi:hypothetical protein